MQRRIEVYDEWALRMATDIELASETICISSLSVHPPKPNDQRPIGKLWSAVIAAKKRGVQVEFWLPAPHKSYPATALNGAAAMKLYERGIPTTLIYPSRLLHAKTCVIDRRLCWVGSGNWTAAASAHNHEFYARFESEEAAAKIVEKLRSIPP